MSSTPEPLRCMTCGAALSARDIDRSLGVATCSNCSAVIDLRSRVPAAEPPAQSDRTHEGSRPRLPIPERFQLSEEPGSMRIEWRWFRPASLFLLGFCVFWDGFLVVWYSVAFSSGEMVMALFPLLHVAVGLGLSYTALASLLNRTVVEVRPHELSITHGPIPWRGVRVARGALTQLYVEEKVSRSKNGTTVTWTVSAVLNTGRRQVLLTGLDEKGQALYLERALEARLGIVPEPVEGEAK